MKTRLQNTHIDGEDVICVREEPRARDEDCSNMIPSELCVLDFFYRFFRDISRSKSLVSINFPFAVHDNVFHTWCFDGGRPEAIGLSAQRRWERGRTPETVQRPECGT